MIRVTFATRLGLLVRPATADEYADLQIQDPQGRVMKENSFRTVTLQSNGARAPISRLVVVEFGVKWM